MKRLFLLPLLLLTLAMGSLHAQQAQTYTPYHFIEGSTWLPGVLIVRIKPEYRALCQADAVADPQLQTIFMTLGVSRVRKAFPHIEQPREKTNAIGQELVDLSLIYEINLPLDADLERAIDRIRFSPAVEYAEPNYTFQLMFDPNDPDTAQQVYLNQMHVREAWDVSRGDSTCVVGIIDTGTSFSHPELAPRIITNTGDPVDGNDNDNDGYVDNNQGWDFGGDYFQSPGDNYPQWSGGGATDHGVLVSGPIGAITDNNLNMASVGYDCRFLPVKTNVNGDVVLIRAYQGVVYAADHGAHVMNLSFGGPGGDRFGEDATRYAAINKGVLLMGSAGNTVGDYRFYPASYPWVLSVAGSMGNDVFWTNGGAFGSTYSYQVDMVAQAQNVYTTAQNGGCWGGATGTSMSTPLAVGTAVLVKGAFPALNMHQVGQRVRVTADDIYSNNTIVYAQKMGRGRVNAFRAVTESTPSVRVAEVKYEDTDGDGLFMGGDTVLVRVRFVNYLDPVNNVNVTMTSPNGSQVTVLHGSAYLGDMNTLDTVGAWYCPFRIKIGAATSSNYTANLKFAYTGTGYTDYEYYTINLTPNFVEISESDFETCIDNIGHFSVFNFPALSQGNGTAIEGAGNYLLDAGFLFGTSATRVSNNVHNNVNNQDAHFQSAQTAYKEVPGVYADLDATSVFNDNGAGANQHDITVTEKVYQYDVESDDDYLIIEYEIHNDGASAVSNAYAGMYTNWELGWPVNNYSRYDGGNRTVWMHEPIGTPPHHLGMSLLTNDSLHAFTSSIDSINFTMAEKWAALTANPVSANSDTTDIVQFISAGPFNIPAGGTHKVAFAWLYGRSPSDVFNARAAALKKYNCVILGQMPLVDLGADVNSCIGNTNLTLDAGAGYASYSWNTGASTQTISVNSTGDYRCTVTTASGCEDYDEVSVVIADQVNGAFTMNPPFGDAGDTIEFIDNTPGSNEWCWNFGDGTDECPVMPVTTHVFANAGTYPVTLIVANGPCSDTVTFNITIAPNAVTSAATAHSLHLYPNPAQSAVTLEWDGAGAGEARLVAIDALGREIMAANLPQAQGRFDLEVSGWPAGLYFLSLRDGAGQSWTGKLVVQD